MRTRSDRRLKAKEEYRKHKINTKKKKRLSFTEFWRKNFINK